MSPEDIPERYDPHLSKNLRTLAILPEKKVL